MPIEIERLTADDVDGAQRLSTQAGWNQTEADWFRLLDLFPNSCFGGYVGDQLVATSTLASYGDVGWIGMILVDEAHRRRGYGSELFERALDAARDEGLEMVGLDATDAGRNVYRQYGFESVEGIDRWAGSLEEGAIDGEDGTRGRVTLLDEAAPIAAFDQMHVGVDRSALLEHLIAADGTTAVRFVRDGRTRGYAAVRPGRVWNQIGPVVAVNGNVASALLTDVAERIDEPVVIDALRTDRIESLLRRCGLDIQRRLHRMTDGESRSALSGDAIVAAAGFEWG